jgi:hypothetical protein
MRRERERARERRFIGIWRLKFLKSGLAGTPALGHDAEDVNDEAHAGEREREREGGREKFINNQQMTEGR